MAGLGPALLLPSEHGPGEGPESTHCCPPDGPLSLRVFGRLPVTDVTGARRQASEKPRGRKPRRGFAPAVLSGYGDLAPAFDLIVRCRIGKAAARALRRWCRSLRVRAEG